MAAKQKPAQVLSAAERRAAARAQAAPPEPPKSKAIDPGPLVDELFDLETELAPFRAKLEREKLLRSTIRGLTDDQTSQVSGAKAVAILGARKNETVVDYYGIAKHIGLDRYAQIATATLEKLGQAVNAGILARFLRKEPTGTRPLTLIAKEKALTQAPSTGQDLSPDKSAARKGQGS